MFIERKWLREVQAFVTNFLLLSSLQSDTHAGVEDNACEDITQAVTESTEETGLPVKHT